jgi:hypothetical protein
MYLLARLYLERIWSLAIAFLFAYGTAAWSTGSRAVWQHGPDMLAIAITIYCLARSSSSPRWAAWSGMAATLAYFIRPTSIVVVAATGLFVLVHRRKQFPVWLLLAGLTAAPFFAYHLRVYGRLLPWYFRQADSIVPVSAAALAKAMAAQCISPSRGMFTFSPFLLFSIAGAVVAVRTRWQTPLIWYLLGILGAHWLIISGFHNWDAGWCFGPRYFSDVTPIFLFLLIPLFRTGGLLLRSRVAAAVFVILAAISVSIHFRGAAIWAVQDWNKGGHIQERLWDWRDPQFLRGL